MEFVTISHDAIARQSIVRRPVEARCGCAWCDRSRKSGKLFQYGTERDDRPYRANWHTGLFCSKSCHDTYHG